MSYVVGRLCQSLSGDFAAFAADVQSRNAELYRFLLVYSAQRGFGVRELRFLEILVALSYEFRNSMTPKLASCIAQALPELDTILSCNLDFIDALDLVNEGYFTLKARTGIDCLNLQATSMTRCACEAAFLYLLISNGSLSDCFEGDYAEFYTRHRYFHTLDEIEKHRLFLFEKMMRCINILFWKRKLKGNFIALAASSTAGDEITYNTGGASNVRTKCREIIFHGVTGVPIIPRPRRSEAKAAKIAAQVLEHTRDGEEFPTKRRKANDDQQELDDRLNEALLAFRVENANCMPSRADIGSPYSMKNAYARGDSNHHMLSDRRRSPSKAKQALSRIYGIYPLPGSIPAMSNPMNSDSEESNVEDSRGYDRNEDGVGGRRTRRSSGMRAGPSHHHSNHDDDADYAAASLNQLSQLSQLSEFQPALDSDRLSQYAPIPYPTSIDQGPEPEREGVEGQGQEGEGEGEEEGGERRGDGGEEEEREVEGGAYEEGKILLWSQSQSSWQQDPSFAPAFDVPSQPELGGN